MLPTLEGYWEEAMAPHLYTAGAQQIVLSFPALNTPQTL